MLHKQYYIRIRWRQRKWKYFQCCRFKEKYFNDLSTILNCNNLTLSYRGKVGDYLNRQIWTGYTSQKHSLPTTSYQREIRDAVGIIARGWLYEDSYLTSKRESFFHTELIQKYHKIDIEYAKTSMKFDQRHFLNFIAGNNNLNDDLLGLGLSSQLSEI